MDKSISKQRPGDLLKKRGSGRPNTKNSNSDKGLGPGPETKPVLKLYEESESIENNEVQNVHSMGDSDSSLQIMEPD